METTINDVSSPIGSAAPTSKTKLWVGRVLTGIPVLFLATDGLMKFLNIPEVVEGSAKMGFHSSTLPLLGAIEILSVILLSIRRTTVFGAVLISAYLGGAVAHARAARRSALFAHARSRLRRRTDLGWTPPARRTRSRAFPVQELRNATSDSRISAAMRSGQIVQRRALPSRHHRETRLSSAL